MNSSSFKNKKNMDYEEIEESLILVDEMFRDLKPKYFKILDEEKWFKGFNLGNNISKDLKHPKINESGVYEYWYNGELIYVGATRRSILERNNSFKRNVKNGIYNPKHLYNEAHAKKWVIKYNKKTLSGITTKYCPCYSRLVMDYEKHRIDLWVKSFGKAPILNKQKIT